MESHRQEEEILNELPSLFKKKVQPNIVEIAEINKMETDLRNLTSREYGSNRTPALPANTNQDWN